MHEKEPITLATLYSGAVIEAVDHEIANALANIMDVNTSPSQARTVTLKLKIKPNKERNIASVAFQASSALAAAEALAPGPMPWLAHSKAAAPVRPLGLHST